MYIFKNVCQQAMYFHEFFESPDHSHIVHFTNMLSYIDENAFIHVSKARGTERKREVTWYKLI